MVRNIAYVINLLIPIMVQVLENHAFKFREPLSQKRRYVILYNISIYLYMSKILINQKDIGVMLKIDIIAGSLLCRLTCRSII